MTASPRDTMRRTALTDASLSVIREGQTPEGAYLACPTFPTYRYSWFRDGAFIAEAMDEWRQHESARAFHEWVVRTITMQAPLADGISAEEDPDPSRLLHTRYQADGKPGSEDWPNFQLDGFGTWLWAYERHLERTGGHPSEEATQAVRLVADYLVALWSRPNYDCWEEHQDQVHPSTLGALHAGLRAAARILGAPGYAGAATAIRSYLLAHGVRDGHFTKHVGSDAVDANLLWLIVPYEVLPPEHPIARATAREVRKDLLDPEGGVHRYQKDTYYGGGSWIILTAALAQYHVALGEREEAERLLEWIEAQATADGHLPEQTAGYLNDPSRLSEWEARWGASACPLLWSHATYLSLVKHLEGA